MPEGVQVNGATAFPMWGREYGKAFGADAAKARHFGQWIARRYAGQSHVPWIVSGEYDSIGRLGGTDFTMAIEKLILEEFKKKHKVEFDPADPNDAAFLQDIREKAERAKQELSKLDSATIPVMARGVQVMLQLPRDEFDELTKNHVNRIREKCLTAIKKGVGDVSKLSRIVLVGGANRLCPRRGAASDGVIEDSMRRGARGGTRPCAQGGAYGSLATPAFRYGIRWVFWYSHSSKRTKPSAPSSRAPVIWSTRVSRGF
jgi:hypothetical protein